MFNPLPYACGLYRYHSLRGEPIVVGGCERSGTTLMQSILSAHPSILAIATETWAFAHGARAGFDDGRTFRPERLWKGLGQEPRAPSNTRWAEKSPANIFQFQEILDHFENRVRLIQLVRDGRDVVTSIHPDRQEPWVPVQRWIDAVSAGLRFRDHLNVMTVRYEDLVADSAATIASVLSFLGEDVPGATDAGRRSWLEGWHEHATMKSSRNLIGSRIGPVHSRSVRKWTRPGFPFRHRVDRLVADPLGEKLLRIYEYQV